MDRTNFSYKTEEQFKKQEAAAECGIRCPHCGASVSADCEICPSCGRKLVEWCTFCGAPMSWSDSECPECGAPSGGLTCPSCGELSLRAFCPKCGSPITRAAVRMVEAARRDPLCEKAAAGAQKVRELEDRLQEAPPAQAVQIKEDLIKVTSDLNALMEQMLPPAGSTPQEQRNYYSARKVAVETRTVTKHKVGWVCNYCGATHANPSECCKPFLGGKWVYEDIVDIKIDYRK